MLYSIMLIILFFSAIVLIGLFSYAITKNIKLSNYVSSTHYGELVQLLQDKHELHRFGYGQYLKRGYSDFNAFHMSFMQMGIITILIFMANFIFATVSISYALLIFAALSIFYIMTAVANAQLLANQPTAGGLYHVIYKQVGSIWASFVGIVKVAAQLTTAVLYSFILAKLISIILEPTYSFFSKPSIIVVMMILIIVLQALIANFRSSVTRWIQGIGILLFWLILLTLCISIFLVILPTGYNPFIFLVGEAPYITSSELNVTLAVAFVIVILAKCFVGHDEASTNAEETIEPKIKIPWATYLSTSYTVIFGFVFLLLLGVVYFYVTATHYVSGDITWWINSLIQLPTLVQYCIIIFLITVSWYNGLFTLVNGSRHLMAMARDEMIPFSVHIAKITLLRQTPHHAILVFAIFSSIAAVGCLLFSSEYMFITQLIILIVACYSFIYTVAIFFSYFKQDSEKVWMIRRGHHIIKLIAIIFNIVMCTLSIYFVNWKLIAIVLGLALLNALYSYFKHGFIKLIIQTHMKKNEFELERNFPLQ